MISRSDHNVSRSDISNNALRVLYRLKDAGYEAFLVGGCVRDLLLGRHPKDFDVATDALPDEVRSLFRNCRLVGRRFRLAHIVFGREVIEVATFRASSVVPDDEPVDPESEEGDEDLEDEELADEEREPADEAPPPPRAREEVGDIDHARVQDTHGRLLRDNVYGSIDDDVWRRDFTVNALYYNIRDFSIWDYVGGAEDLAAHRLRLIGDPETRYREDPVRMLRAARFEAKLGFELDAASAEPIERLRSLLAGVPPARLFDEVQKLFLTGHGVSSLDVLRRRGLLSALLPTVDRFLSAHPGSLIEQLLRRGLANTDQRVAEGKPVSPTFLFALLLYGPIAAYIESLPPQRWHETSAILEGCERALREATQRVTIPRRIALGIREIYAVQPRLERPRGRRALRLLENARFRAGFDLLVLRAELGMASREVSQWWDRLQHVGHDEQVQMTEAPPGGADASGDAGGGVVASTGATAAPRSRRRRRRRPRGAGSG